MTTLLVTYTCLGCGLRTSVHVGQDYRACACDAGYETDSDAVPDVPAPVIDDAAS